MSAGYWSSKEGNTRSTHVSPLPGRNRSDRQWRPSRWWDRCAVRRRRGCRVL